MSVPSIPENLSVENAANNVSKDTSFSFGNDDDVATKKLPLRGHHVSTSSPPKEVDFKVLFDQKNGKIRLVIHAPAGEVVIDLTAKEKPTSSRFSKAIAKIKKSEKEKMVKVLIDDQEKTLFVQSSELRKAVKLMAGTMGIQEEEAKELVLASPTERDRIQIENKMKKLQLEYNQIAVKLSQSSRTGIDEEAELKELLNGRIFSKKLSDKLHSLCNWDPSVKSNRDMKSRVERLLKIKSEIKEMKVQILDLKIKELKNQRSVPKIEILQLKILRLILKNEEAWCQEASEISQGVLITESTIRERRNKSLLEECGLSSIYVHKVSDNDPSQFEIIISPSAKVESLGKGGYKSWFVAKRYDSSLPLPEQETVALAVASKIRVVEKPQIIEFLKLIENHPLFADQIKTWSEPFLREKVNSNAKPDSMSKPTLAIHKLGVSTLYEMGSLDKRGAGFLSATSILNIVEAVKFMHDNGWAHLDLKDGNVLLDEVGKTKLSDFDNITKVLKGKTRVYHFIGTPKRVGPDRLIDAFFKLEVTYESYLKDDMFALAAMLYKDIDATFKSAGYDPTPKAFKENANLMKRLFDSLSKHEKELFDQANKRLDRPLTSEEEKLMISLHNKLAGTQLVEYNKWKPKSDDHRPFYEYRFLLWKTMNPDPYDRPTIDEFLKQLVDLDSLGLLPRLPMKTKATVFSKAA